MVMTMKAVRAHEFGGPETLVYDDVPVPEPGPGDVLIRVHAAGLNPPDWYARTGFANIPEAMRPAPPKHRSLPAQTSRASSRQSVHGSTACAWATPCSGWCASP